MAERLLTERLSPARPERVSTFVVMTSQPDGDAGHDKLDIGSPQLWLDELKRIGAAQDRRRSRSFEQQLNEQATLSSLLVDLAASQSAAVFELAAGRSHSGTVQLVGLDVVVIASGQGDQLARRTDQRITLMARDALQVVRSSGSRRLQAGADDEHVADVTMLELLADQLDDRPSVVITTRGGHTASGQLIAVGHDMVTVHPSTPDPASVHVGAATIVDITVG